MLRNITDGVTVAQQFLAVVPGNASASDSWSDLFVMESKSGSRGNKTYAWQYNATFGITSFNVSASCSQLWWNR